jgi:hypothetical protein
VLDADRAREADPDEGHFFHQLISLPRVPKGAKGVCGRLRETTFRNGKTGNDLRSPKVVSPWTCK